MYTKSDTGTQFARGSWRFSFPVFFGVMVFSLLVAFGLWLGGAHGAVAQTSGCTPGTSNCAWDGNGNFVGYNNPWPPNCIYVIPGLSGSQSGKPAGGGRPAYNPSDRSGSTTAPICRPEPVPPFRITYYERGHRMYQTGTYIGKDGCANKYLADGTFLRRECFNTAGTGYGEGSQSADGQNASPVEANFTVGWIDQATCDGIQGWSYDADNISAPVTIHLYVDGKAGSGGKLLTSGTTDLLRSDINDSFGLTGNHGFLIKLPDSVRDGKSHTIYAYGIDTNGGESRSLGGGGKPFNCTGNTGTVSTNPTPANVVDKTSPLGWFDSASATAFAGWAFDADNSSAVIDVHFYANAPVDKGGTLIGFAKTTVQRGDINSLYKINGTHGFTAAVTKAGSTANANFTAGNVVVPAALYDGKAHPVYAYAIDSNGSKNPLTGGSPKSVVFGTGGTTGGGTGGGGGGGAGGSSRHNYLTPCNSSGYADIGDPGIAVVTKADGSLELTVSLHGVTDPVSVDGKAITADLKQTVKAGTVVTVTVGGDSFKFTVDTDGMKAVGAGTMSNLVPMPCIRIGYNDVLGGQQCEPGQGGTCADSLHVFCGPGAWQNNILKDGEFEIWLKVVGDQTNIPWKKIDYIHDDNYASPNAIQVKGAGTVYCMTVAIGKDGSRNSSLVATKTYDIPKGNFE